jgi:hypothetical protein
MKHMLLFLTSVTFLLAGTLKQDGLPGIEIQTGPSGTRFVTEPAGNSTYPGTATEVCGNTRAEVLWVDRNHQNAIAQHTAISGNGMWLQAGWYLNNERTSLYRTLGAGTPSWTYPMPNADWFISTDVSYTGSNIGVIAQGEPCYNFSSSSTAPNWVYNLPPGFDFASSAQGPTVCVSDDGTICAAVASQGTNGRVFIMNSDGDTVRTIAFNPNTGIYGLDMANDGSVLCVSTYNAIYIFNADGSRRDSVQNYGQTVAKISGDGAYMVKGDFNTRAYLYRWNGSSYTLVWQCYTGHPWVTAVAISDDGSTIMAGTYQYSPTNTGKVLLFDSSSATPLWQYAQYGDYVASCALSEDGSRAVAGSWGQYGATFGDVLTVFDRNSSTPIFQLLDDIDEPGSIFSVDISKDGAFVTAGGKAVHAREFGNGGEVYAIRMLDPLTNDVGVEIINVPSAFLQVGQSITPQAIVRNYGTQNATFSTFCYIRDSLAQTLYADTADVTNLAPGSGTTINFAGSWNVPAYGEYQTIVFTALAGDQFPLNDTLIAGSICFHDGAVSSILYPFSELTINYSNTPRVSISNHGSYAENIPVTCKIYDNLGTLVYTGTGQYYLSPLQTQTVSLTPNWSPADTGSYDADFFTEVIDDYVPSNDTMHRAILSTTEILYDDSFLDVYGYVSTNFADNKFAEKMIPCLTPPYYITRTRFYTSGPEPVIVSLNKDSLGFPGLGPTYYLAEPETVSAAGPGWSISNIVPPIQMATSDPFWFVVHWLSGSPSAPYVGMDNTQPMDNLSYWYWTDPQSPGWHFWTGYDFMMRTMTVAEVGIEDYGSENPISFAVHAPAPNPFKTNLAIGFSVPTSSKMLIRAYDITGRLVASIMDEQVEPGEHQVIWNGIDDNGRRVSSGIYFLRVACENLSVTRKVIVIAE